MLINVMEELEGVVGIILRKCKIFKPTLSGY
jgi:hypothetical protein